MNQDLIVEETMAYVKLKLEGDGSGHDWFHVLRVYNNALDIVKNEKGVNIFIVKLGALLHDIADHKFGYSDLDRENIISNFLNKYNLPQKYIDEIIYIANYISFKEGNNTYRMKSIEGKIVQDADRLDAMGAIGIGRAFTYGGYNNRTMYMPKSEDMNEQVEGTYKNTDTISHFYEKLLLLKDKMNTETGRRKAEVRHKTMEEFVHTFFKEWNGDI